MRSGTHIFPWVIGFFQMLRLAPDYVFGNTIWVDDDLPIR